jgi:hypothetical protein
MRLATLFITMIATLGTFSSIAQTTNYQVYALFVVNIAKYSAWPNAGNEMNITVLGKSKVYEELMKQNGKTIGNFTIKVTQAEEPSKVGQPHIVFVADGKSGSLEELVKLTEGKPVMIIAEREGLFRKGAGFSFLVLDNGTLRYDINNGELEKRQIKVSKNLSTLANSII